MHEIENIQTMSQVMRHNNVEYGTSSSQNDLLDEVVQETSTMNEGTSQNIGELEM